MRTTEEVGHPILTIFLWSFHKHCGHLCCHKKFQILVTSDLHRLADDANENDNYIA